MIDANFHKFLKLSCVRPRLVCNLPIVNATKQTNANLNYGCAIGCHLVSTRILKKIYASKLESLLFIIENCFKITKKISKYN